MNPALIAAFAARQKAILLHEDPEFELLADYVCLEALPYKIAEEQGDTRS